ncbi:NAD(P)-binding domain-containing protein, partial [Neoaquamicrobium sediminum]|uniref:NAD(P)-binding domain-containing protein n=1 Tax=Neoaquamicrobium sediminum TaxID=1849104 RepID=UPI0040368639
MKTVAFIGLGHMGLPMAANLVKAGYNVRGYDLSDACRAAAREAGIPVAADSAEAIEAAEVIITMLPKGEHVVSVYGDLVRKIPAGTLLIDCSTVDRESALKAHE